MSKRIQKPTITVSTDIDGNQETNITNDENNMTIEETYHDKDYIDRGWSNRRTSSYNHNITTYDINVYNEYGINNQIIT
ncbi:unnamed protein product [Rotaria sp. Silwood1]|nr:unnamed protein product [Rotaria sp. Silwood1]CAF4903640.1 unnamed protein product [Rotaria sp. Silwood1]